MNKTGAYGTVTIELDVTSLAFNTILESGRINDVEVWDRHLRAQRRAGLGLTRARLSASAIRFPRERSARWRRRRPCRRL